MRSLLLVITVIATALLAPIHIVLAQAFPSKVIRIVIPLTAGSSSDAQARIIGPLLSERWKQQVIVDARPGAATVIGTDLVAKSPPDGHTLLLTSTQYTHVVALSAKLPYDPYTDLVPVTVVTTSPQAIISHPSLPAKNIKELIAFARGHSLNIGTTGNELTARYFNMLSKLTIVPVPYKGGAPLVIDVMGGHVELGIGGVITFQPQVRSGRVRLLGIASLTPSSIFPDAPLIPKDVPGFEVLSWWGIFAPGNTPREVVTRIRDDIAAVLQVPNVRERLLELGGEPGGETAEDFNARVRTEIARWINVAKEAGIKPQ
jgi:tripartite-type tricarboxylate transporter receptor subunit TctC